MNLTEQQIRQLIRQCLSEGDVIITKDILIKDYIHPYMDSDIHRPIRKTYQGREYIIGFDICITHPGGYEDCSGSWGWTVEDFGVYDETTDQMVDIPGRKNV